jgi:hypothetical protein
MSDNRVRGLMNDRIMYDDFQMFPRWYAVHGQKGVYGPESSLGPDMPPHVYREYYDAQGRRVHDQIEECASDEEADRIARERNHC